ncbi:MAG: hypothetical protein IAE63_04150 [Alphaproteobacteria bacterium]|nr:hypothetical protein [Alphaproteobacteria bacterium]
MAKKLENLAMQGDISFLKVDAHIKEAMSKIFRVDIDAIIQDASKKITNTLKGNNPADAGLHPQKGLVVAQGESRQHYHAFRDPDKVDAFEAVNDNTRIRLLVVKEKCFVEHEEHDPIELDEGIYIQGFQYEYSFEDEYRRVMD